MQNDVVEKARNLGRPLSSFRERDMSLNEAQPSVLGHASGGTNGRSETKKVIRTISAPRTVYAQFQDAQPNGESRPELCNDHTTPDSAVCTDVINFSDACMRLDFQDTTRTQKVQFEDSRNQVTTYTPSPMACPTAGRVATEMMHVKQHPTHKSAVWSIAHAADPRFTAEEEEQHGGGISRCASNLGSRAGTFNELMAVNPKLWGRQRQFGGRPEGVQISDCDPQPSRCASNMSTRAGTFNEITADLIAAHPLSLGDSLLDSSAMLSTVSLGSQHPSRCPPTRRVSNMMSCAGTFEEVLDTSEFAVDNELFDGTISRRATNMHTAAGAFEELVDEDGDELGPEEHSCSSMESGEDSEGVNISLSGMVSNVGVAHDSAEEFDRSPLISLHSDIPEPQKAQEFQGGWGSIRPVDPSAGTGDALLASEFLYGVLPSDVLEEVNEGTGCNPMATAEPSHDICKYEAQDNGPSTGLRAGPQGTGIWGPTPEQDVSAKCIRQTQDIKFDASNSSDRLAMIREQIKSLALEEQKLLLSTLSADLSTGSEEPANSMPLAMHLSIHTPHRTLKHFQFEEELEGDLSGPLLSSSLQLQKSSSVAGMTVRTPRAKYNVVFAGDENAAMPSAMAAIESKQEAVARAILTPMEWSMKLAHKSAVSGPGHGALSHPSSNDGLRVKLMPASSAQERTTRLEAYRP